jgi:SanA protein
MLPVLITTSQKIMKLVFYSIIILLLAFSISKLIVVIYSHNRMYKLDDVSDRSIAIVFGAGLWKDGSPTPILRDRVKTAADLYFAGKVHKLLMSGDNRVVNYNEPAAMGAYARSLGIPDEDIVLDFAGRRTYDTCFRAEAIFGLEDAILVTQKFHLPRALYICNKLGIDTVGVAADQRKYKTSSLNYWKFREFFATIVALWEVHITQPLPVLGDPEPIFTTNHSTSPNGGNT